MKRDRAAFERVCGQCLFFLVSNIYRLHIGWENPYQSYAHQDWWLGLLWVQKVEVMYCHCHLIVMMHDSVFARFPFTGGSWLYIAHNVNNKNWHAFETRTFARPWEETSSRGRNLIDVWHVSATSSTHHKQRHRRGGTFWSMLGMLVQLDHFTTCNVMLQQMCQVTLLDAIPMQYQSIRLSDWNAREIRKYYSNKVTIVAYWSLPRGSDCLSLIMSNTHFLVWCVDAAIVCAMSDTLHAV